MAAAQAEMVGESARESKARPGYIAEVCRELWRIEQELALLQATASGVHWWPPMRVETFYRLTKALGLFGEPQPKASKPVPPHWRRPLDRVRAALIQPVGRWRRARFLVFPHERKVDYGQGPIDIYTERLCRELAPQDTLIVDRTPRSATQRAAHLGVERLKAAIKARERDGWRPLLQEQRRFEALEEALARAFDTRIPIARLGPRRVRTFIAARQVYGDLMDRLGTQSVFVVVGYLKHALNAAAQDRGIRVHEFQHAAITPYSLGYSFPGRPYVPYSPDTVLCFGPFWAKVAEFPANTRPIVVGRTAALDALLAHAPRKRARQVVVISQGVIGADLVKLTVRAARLAPGYRFAFRRHPGEIESDLNAALRETGLECPPNFAIVGSEQPLHERLAEAEVQVGVYSTGLFEGMMLGCRTIVAELPGHEAMEPAVRRGDAVVAATPEELVASLSVAPLARPDPYYAAPVASIRELVGAHGEL